MKKANTSVVATADNAAGSLRSGRLNPAVPHLKRSTNKKMKLIHCILAVAATLVISCKQKTENSTTVEKHEEKVNPFIGEWVQIGKDNTIKFISQGDTILFNDGTKNFKAESAGENSINVDFSSTVLGIVVFEYSKDKDSISALGDTFKRKEK